MVVPLRAAGHDGREVVQPVRVSDRERELGLEPVVQGGELERRLRRGLGVGDRPSASIAGEANRGGVVRRPGRRGSPPTTRTARAGAAAAPLSSPAACTSAALSRCGSASGRGGLPTRRSRRGVQPTAIARPSASAPAWRRSARPPAQPGTRLQRSGAARAASDIALLGFSESPDPIDQSTVTASPSSRS